MVTELWPDCPRGGGGEGEGCIRAEARGQTLPVGTASQGLLTGVWPSQHYGDWKTNERRGRCDLARGLAGTPLLLTIGRA